MTETTSVKRQCRIHLSTPLHLQSAEASGFRPLYSPSVRRHDNNRRFPTETRHLHPDPDPALRRPLSQIISSLEDPTKTG